MHGFFRFYVVFWLCVILPACRSSVDGQKASGRSERGITETRFNARDVVVAPNHCRILATVVFIDTIYRSENPSDPCSNAPCRANVRVDSIIGYGQAFTSPFAMGDTLAVSFSFTVAPTKEILPRMTQSYPGVRVGTRIVTDVQALPTLAIGQKSDLFFNIYGYSVQ